jgi:hypothetical protein
VAQRFSAAVTALFLSTASAAEVTRSAWQLVFPQPAERAHPSFVFPMRPSRPRFSLA